MFQFHKMFRFVLVATVAALARAAYIPSQEPADEGIVGGVNATIKQYPYQLALEFKKGFWCGASLIKRNIALTAAHCTKGKSAKDFKVRAGSTYKEKGGKLVNVRKIYDHPKYNADKIDYDVSILILDKKLPLSASIQTISLQPLDAEIPVGTPAYATGWGGLKPGQGTIILQAVKIPKVCSKRCAKVYKPLGMDVTARMTCYGYSKAAKGGCSGDSGGPIVVNGTQTGVASWTKDACAQPGYPTVFAKVSHKEIRAHINKYISGF